MHTASVSHRYARCGCVQATTRDLAWLLSLEMLRIVRSCMCALLGIALPRVGSTQGTDGYDGRRDVLIYQSPLLQDLRRIAVS